MSTTTYSEGAIPQATEAGAWAELACGVVRSVQAHACLLKADERDQFRRDLDALLTTLNDTPSPSVLRTSTATLEEKIRQYFERAQKEIDRSLGELRQLVSVLMASLGHVEETEQGTASSLAVIGQTVQEARSPGELAVAKIHLVQALGRLKSEADTRRRENFELLTSLQEKAHALELAPIPQASRPTPTARDDNSGTGPPDSVTGLYGRQAAESSLLGLSEKTKANTYVVCFYIQRMELINSRFGDRMGTDVLCYCAQHFARLAQPADQLFRWRGPGFVALLSRGRSLSDVRQEVNSSYRNRMTFEGADNSVLIPLSIITQVWPARKVHAAELIHNIETFFSLPATRGMAESSDSSGLDELGDEDFADET